MPEKPCNKCLTNAAKDETAGTDGVQKSMAGKPCRKLQVVAQR